MSPRPQPRLVVTDLDGTLLDEETYDLGPARHALEALRAESVPLVLCSSKTQAEMEPLAATLGLTTPLIVENGGAIVVPAAGTAPGPSEGRAEGRVIVLGTPRAELIAALPEIATEAGVRVRSFAAMPVEEVARRTGLDREAAALAQRREWDEPFAVEAPRAPGLDERLDDAARRRGLRVTRGGRFHHLTGPSNKGDALRALLAFFPRKPSGPTVGLGDAANDLPLLLAVDRPILMPRREGGFDPVLASALPTAERAPGPGPAGWAAAVLGVLAGEALLHVTS